MTSCSTKITEEYHDETLQIILDHLSDIQKAELHPSFKAACDQILRLCRELKTAGEVTAYLNNGHSRHDSSLARWLQRVTKLEIMDRPGIGPKAGIWTKITDAVRKDIEPKATKKDTAEAPLRCKPETIEKIQKQQESNLMVSVYLLKKYKLVTEEVIPMVDSIAISAIPIE